MYLNTISPSKNSKFHSKRLGRGIGSGLGKTCGRGHKGQKSRSGGKVSYKFEGGQTPLYRRLPKFGFKSHVKKINTQIRLSSLNKIDNNVINIEILKKNKIIKKKVISAKIILFGKIFKRFTVYGIKVSRGARIEIENYGGEIKEN